MIADAAFIETLAFRAWPAETEVDIDGWKLRHSPGIGARRINSATTPVDRGPDPATAEQMVISWFEERATDPVIRILSVSDPTIDRYLQGAGWQRESLTLTMSRRLGAVDADRHLVAVEPAPTPEWVAAKQRLTGMSDEMIGTWLRRAGAIEGDTGFASIRVGDELAAIGLGVLDDAWLGLFDLNTAPPLRRRGLGRSVVASLEEWAVHAGASSAYLQVEEENRAAVALYRSGGYVDAYGYWYRRCR